MLDERLLDYDPSTGMKTWFSSSDDDGGTWNLRYEQDVSPLLDANKSAQVDSWDKRADMWHAASIPNVVLMEWVVKHGIEYWNPNHKEGVKRLLNSDEYRHLRVRNFII
jgi:hypothetical protein